MVTPFVKINIWLLCYCLTCRLVIAIIAHFVSRLTKNTVPPSWSPKLLLMRYLMRTILCDLGKVLSLLYLFYSKVYREVTYQSQRLNLGRDQLATKDYQEHCSSPTPPHPFQWLKAWMDISQGHFIHSGWIFMVEETCMFFHRPIHGRLHPIIILATALIRM